MSDLRRAADDDHDASISEEMGDDKTVPRGMYDFMTLTNIRELTHGMIKGCKFDICRVRTQSFKFLRIAVHNRCIYFSPAQPSSRFPS